MTARVGIPSSLFYYVHFPMWQTFFSELGIEVVTSGQTTKGLLDEGVKEALADACVPIKLFFGHVIALKDKVDYLFIPRVVCLNRKTIYCPKFLGLPDMIRHGLSGMPPIIDVEMDNRQGWTSLWKSYLKIGRIFGRGKMKIFMAYLKARSVARRFHSLLLAGMHPPEAITALAKGANVPLPGEKKKGDLVFAVLGYPYEVHDQFISVGLVKKLKKMGVSVITMENLPPKKIARANMLEKKMFWTFSDLALNAAYYLFREGKVDGIIHLTAFGCGPDSMVDKLMELASRDYPDIPYMSVTIDEHTGDAGISTRLEAFLDMVKRKKEALQSTCPR
ncbi:MAG: acyl-CoA dehydratase activase-related protein [Peptococcaceae bacterium]|nr:acyl-CoA dehydratase activase-related protein [Peptococcaceae bacterium]